MKKVTIFSTKICPYCMRAKSFFDRKNIPYESILVDENPEEMEKMVAKSKRQSVPQIFIGSELEYHVGGFDDLMEHDMEGKLQGLLED